MRDQRLEPRLMCADLVSISWRDDAGRTKKSVANLEDISGSGACLQLDSEIPLNLQVKLSFPKRTIRGTVRYCVYREIGYFIGVQFEPGEKWSASEFKPEHLFDPRHLTETAPPTRLN